MSIGLPGKFGRFRATAASVTGSYRWNVGFRRERLDLTNFESAVGVSGINVFSEGDTGPMDTTFQVEVYATTANVNVFFPEGELTCDLLFKKTASLGYNNIAADVLSLTPNTEVRGLGKYVAELQSNGLVTAAA